MATTTFCFGAARTAENPGRPTQLVYEEGGESDTTIGNTCPVLDRQTGTVWLFMTRDNDAVFVAKSTDDGESWSKPLDVTAQAKKPAWGWYATGPGVGIQLSQGKHNGRLVIPCDHRETKSRSGPSLSHMIYSDDHGASWKLGESVGPQTNECQVAELADGRLVVNCRNHWGRSGKRPELAGRRIIAHSSDGGHSWSEPSFDETLIEPQCQASLIARRMAAQQGCFSQIPLQSPAGFG
jgi:sialidase-1